MKKLTLFFFIGMFLVGLGAAATWGSIIGGDDAEVIFNSPADDYTTLINEVLFNCSANVTGGATLANISLWTNESGSWEYKNNSALTAIDISYSTITNYYKLDSVSNPIRDYVSGIDQINLTPSNTPTTATGIISNAISLDGTNQYASGSNIAAINVNNEYSISVWVNSDTISGEDHIMAQYNSGDNRMSLGAKGSDICFGTYNGATTGEICSDGSLSSDTWYHVVVNHYPNNTNIMWLDNVKQSGAAQTIQNPSDTGFYLGQRQGGLLYWDGEIDEVAIFNTTITDAEVSTFYNSGSSYRPSGSVTSTTQTWNRTLTTPITWACRACDSDGDCGFTTTNRTLNIDTGLPKIEVETPSGTSDYARVGDTETLNVTITDTNLDSCWYDYNGTNHTIVGCQSGVKNSTTFILETDNTNMTIWSNDSIGNINSTFIDWNYRIFETGRSHNQTTYETARESYEINITANSSLTAVNLYYNATSYSATQSGNTWTYSRDLPNEARGNNSVTWNFTYAGSTIDSTYRTYQNVSQINLTYCQTGTPHVNFTFKDEDDNAKINATIPSSTFSYWIGNGDVKKTYSYINNTENYHYAFCLSPINRNATLDYRMQYESDGYPQRIAEPDNFIIDNSTVEKTLYLLNTVDGIYVTFQVINTADILISGVDVTAVREIASEDVTVATGTTGASGSVTFWLNPDFSHDFTFTKSGYETYEYTDTPTQTSYTITMTSGDATTNNTYDGIIFSTRPTNGYLVNDTEYTFAFNLTSSVYDVTEYGFNLRLANGTTFNGGSTGVEGTELTLVYNVSNESIIYMDYYWVIDGNYTNSSTSWIVFDESNTGWSLKNFFTYLTKYLDSGIFGLDNFGRIFIAFLILFISVGIMSYKYGFTSPMAITTMIFSIVFFMDVVTGIIPDIYRFKNLPTFAAGIVLALVVMNEVRVR